MNELLSAVNFPSFVSGLIKGGLRLAVGTSSGRLNVAFPAHTLGLRRPWPVLDFRDGLQVLAAAVRRRVARERQKSLALVMMLGINRIVVRDGRIPARIGS